MQGFAQLKERDKCLFPLPTISEQEFVDHIADNDFLLVYGNPVIINCNAGYQLICMAWPMMERFLRLIGRDDKADEFLRQIEEEKKRTELKEHENHNDDG